MSIATDFAKKIAGLIAENTDRIEADAVSVAQSQQSNDAGDDRAAELWGEVLEEPIRRLVLNCAAVCDWRARNAEYHVSIRNEATKCGDAVRYVILADRGVTEVCLRCDGHGCDRCGKGLVEVQSREVTNG